MKVIYVQGKKKFKKYKNIGNEIIFSHSLALSVQLLRCNLLLIIVYSSVKNLGIYVGLYVSHTFFKKDNWDHTFLFVYKQTCLCLFICIFFSLFLMPAWPSASYTIIN